MSFDTRLAAPVAGQLYLIEMHFTTGVVRATNWNHNLEWGGYTWIGYQLLVSVGALTDGGGIQYPQVDLGLRVANPAAMALARGQVSTYRRRPVKIWLVLLDEQLRPDGDPEPAWAGLMDQVRIKMGDGKEPGMVVMRCELAGRDNRGAQSLRLNDAQHQVRYPGDTFFSRVEALRGRPVPWLSVKFQRR